MADKVLFQTDDDLDQVNLSEAQNRSNATDYVERGLGFTADHTNETLDVESGHAILTNGTEAYDVFPDKKTGLDLATTSGTNYVFLWIDTDDDDTLGYYINDSDSGPTSTDVSADGPIASLKVGTVDAGSDTTSEVNRDPSISADEIDIDTQIVHAWIGGVTYTPYDLADYSDLGSLINQILTDAGGSRVGIMLPAGQLTWDTGITITNNNRSIIGLGHGATEIDAGSASSDLITLGDSNNRPENILLENLRIEGDDSQGNNNANDCIVVQRARNVHGRNVYERQFNRGLVITNSLDVEDIIDSWWEMTVWEDNTQEGIRIDASQSTQEIYRHQFSGGYAFGNRRGVQITSNGSKEAHDIYFNNYEFSSSDRQNILLEGAKFCFFTNFRAVNANKDQSGYNPVDYNNDGTTDSISCGFGFFDINSTNNVGVNINSARSFWIAGEVQGGYNFQAYERTTDIHGVVGWKNIDGKNELVSSSGDTVTVNLDDTEALAFANSRNAGVVATASGFDNNGDLIILLKNIDDGSDASNVTVDWKVYGKTAQVQGMTS